MAGVRDELANPHLACMPSRQRPEMRSSMRFSAEPSWPISVCALGRIDFDDGRRQPNLAAVQLEIGHLPGGGGNR